VESELEQLSKHAVWLLALGSPEYPASLSQIADPPHLLYVRGQLLPADAKAVALVGSRSCSSYGRRMAERLATGLSRAGYSIVSGLARVTSLETSTSGRRWIMPRLSTLLFRVLP